MTLGYDRDKQIVSWSSNAGAVTMTARTQRTCRGQTDAVCMEQTNHLTINVLLVGINQAYQNGRLLRDGCCRL